jgi:hypothetical protein
MANAIFKNDFCACRRPYFCFDKSKQNHFVMQNSLPDGIQPSPCMAQAFSGQAALLLEIPASPMPQTVASHHP